MNFRDVPNLRKFEQHARGRSDDAIVMDCYKRIRAIIAPVPKPPDPLVLSAEPVADLKASCEAVEKIDAAALGLRRGHGPDFAAAVGLPARLRLEPRLFSGPRRPGADGRDAAPPDHLGSRRGGVGRIFRRTHAGGRPGQLVVRVPRPKPRSRHRRSPEGVHSFGQPLVRCAHPDNTDSSVVAGPPEIGCLRGRRYYRYQRSPGGGPSRGARRLPPSATQSLRVPSLPNSIWERHLDPSRNSISRWTKSATELPQQ